MSLELNNKKTIKNAYLATGQTDKKESFIFLEIRRK